jgi:hypothetical protein
MLNEIGEPTAAPSFNIEHSTFNIQHLVFAGMVAARLGVTAE